MQVEIGIDQQLATVYLDSYESSCINLLDPTDLEFEYMQQMTAAIEAFMPGEELLALHLGGAACALPLAWHHLHRGSTQTVVELNGELATAMRELFSLPRAPHLKIRVGEAWEQLSAMRSERFKVIVRDVFAGAQTPRPLRSLEFYRKAYDVLKPGGLLLVNIVHGKGDDARADVAAALDAFEHVSVVSEGAILSGSRRGNVVIVAYKPESSGNDEVAKDNAEVAPATPASVDVTGGEIDISKHWKEFQRLIRRLAIPPRYLNRAEAARWAGTTRPILLEQN
ncbi:MAG: fused MFS/spermidine synthase [Actinomycetaceae bacterium]|nr:fused MFS/spermidine synthase [Actinomycetaceae bacterium]